MKDDLRSTRRAFVAATARRAAYVAPAILTLRAARRAGADFTGCVGPGSPCTMNNPCCSMSCSEPGGMGCMGEPDCTCD